MKATILNEIKSPDLPELKTRPIRAIVYVRVSSDEQAKKEFSIPKIQIPECMQLIKEKGFNPVKTFVDEGCDCNTFLKRPALQEILNDYMDDFDVLIVWSFDRLYGDDENTRGRILNALDKHRKQITSVKQRMEIVSPEEYDPKSLNVSQLRQLNNIGVSWDRKIRRERFMASRNKCVENGRHIVEAPYGYKVMREAIEEGERIKVVSYRLVNEEEALTLKRVFKERVAAEKNVKEIAMGLNKDGIKTRKGSTWSAPRIYQVLKNPFPCGYIVWNKTQQRKFGDDNSYRAFSEDKWQYFPIDRKREKYYKPLISKELFDKCQAISKANKKLSPRATGSKNIVAGLLRCPECNSPMVETSYYKAKKPPFRRGLFQCSRYHNKGECSSKKYVSYPIKELIIKKVEKYLGDPKLFEKYQEKARCQKVERLEKELEGNEKRMKRNEERIHSLNLKYIDAKIKEDYYKELLDELERDAVVLRKNILDLKSEISEYSKRRDTIYKLQNMGKKLRELNDRKKKQVLRALIEEIALTKERKVDILFKV